MNHPGLAIQLHTVSHFQTLQWEVDNSGVLLLDKVVLHEPFVVEDQVWRQSLALEPFELPSKLLSGHSVVLCKHRVDANLWDDVLAFN